MPINEYTSTMTSTEPKKDQGIVHRLRFYRAVARWLWKHRAEPNNRHKMRRMMREVQDG